MTGRPAGLSTCCCLKTIRGTRLPRQMLSEAGSLKTELTHHGSLQRALNHLATNVANIILPDLGLPDADGLGTVRKVHEVAASRCARCARQS